jgi:hypothetical protein
MPVTTATLGDLTLTCDIAREGDAIVFVYSLANQGRAAVFVADATAVADPATGRRRADPRAATTWLGADGQAHVLKGTAPLPPGADPEAPILPLGIRLDPGKTLERRLSEGLPLAEHSPYVPLGNLAEYRLAPIHGVALTLEVLPALPGLVAEARDIARGLWRVADAEAAAGLAQRLTCAFRARGLFMLVRRATYPRPVFAPSSPDPGSGGGNAV